MASSMRGAKQQGGRRLAVGPAIGFGAAVFQQGDLRFSSGENFKMGNFGRVLSNFTPVPAPRSVGWPQIGPNVAPGRARPGHELFLGISRTESEDSPVGDIGQEPAAIDPGNALDCHLGPEAEFGLYDLQNGQCRRCNNLCRRRGCPAGGAD